MTINDMKKRFLIVLAGVFLILLVFGAISLYFFLKRECSEISQYYDELSTEMEIENIYRGAFIELTNSNSNDIYPRFSPDGRWIAYFSNNRPALIDIYGNKYLPTTKKLGIPLFKIKWSSDGKKVIFPYVFNSTFRILIVDLTAQKEILLDNLCHGDWAPQKDLIVTYDTKTQDIVFCDLKENKFRTVLKLTEFVPEPLAVIPIQPFIWHNSKIYFFVNIKQKDTNIYKSKLLEIDVIDSKCRVVIDNDSINENLIISPDGNKLLFTTIVDKKEVLPFGNQLILYDLNKNKIIRLRNMASPLCWSPDSRKIIYESLLAEKNKIMGVTIDTNASWAIDNTSSGSVGGDWSSEYLVFAIPKEDTSRDEVINWEDNKNIVLFPATEISKVRIRD